VEVSESLQKAILGYFTNNLTKEEARELRAWLKEDSSHRDYIAQMKELWHFSGTLNPHVYDTERALKKLRKKIDWRNIRPVYTKTFTVNLRILNRIAAILLVFLSIGILTAIILKKDQPKNELLSFIEMTAPKGAKSFITLNDGTQIWLNADTKLKYPVNFGINKREVFLEGEAYFKVAKNKQFPFRVNTSGMSITATGTAFNVKAYHDENVIETTLEEGQVQIESTKAKGKKKNSPVFLQPGQIAVLRKNADQITVTTKTDKMKLQKEKSDAVSPGLIEVVNVPDTRIYTSWKEDRWIFKNEQLGNLAVKLERRYDVKIIFRDEALKNYAFSGTLKDESLEQVLDALRMTAPIRYDIESKTVFLREDSYLKMKFKNLLQ